MHLPMFLQEQESSKEFGERKPAFYQKEEISNVYYNWR